MFLVQLLLPLRDNEGRPFGRADFERVRSELADRFGGVTAFLQSPASGIWKEPSEGDTQRDERLHFGTGIENRSCHLEVAPPELPVSDDLGHGPEARPVIEHGGEAFSGDRQYERLRSP